MKPIAFYNIKGGVGKTAAAVNVSHIASMSGQKTLLVDLDPQGSASFYFRTKAGKGFSPELLFDGGKELLDNIKGSDFDKLDVLPAKLSFRKLDILLDGMKKSRKALKGIFKLLDYDIIIMDCPPSITLLSENVFYASDIVVVPVIPTTLSKLSFKKLLKFFEKSGYDDSRILAFFSMFEKRKSLHNATVSEMLGKDTHFVDVRIPYSSRVEKMGLTRRPVTAESTASPVKDAYYSLWSEIRKKAHI